MGALIPVGRLQSDRQPAEQAQYRIRPQHPVARRSSAACGGHAARSRRRGIGGSQPAVRPMSVWQTSLERPRQLAARRWLFQVHMWAGVLAAVYVIVASLTGSLIVFREELEALVHTRPVVDV